MNDVKLQGLSHATTIDILQNAPDDVSLVVSQPKERLYKGKSWDMIVVAMCKNSVFCFSFVVIMYRVHYLCGALT